MDHPIRMRAASVEQLPQTWILRDDSVAGATLPAGAPKRSVAPAATDTLEASPTSMN